jgi:predicted DsbA family dithiol-disulfide isomerase
MKIELWSDFACPFCYIGKKRFEQALNAFPHKDQVEVIYKSYQLNPNAPKVMKKSAAESFASGHGMTVAQAKQRFDMFKQQAQTVGLTYDYDKIQMTNSFDAHRLAKWANQFGLEEVLTDRLMKAYFTDGLNIADPKTLVSLAEEVGLDKAQAEKIISSKEYGNQVKNEITEGRQIGVQGVPFFVLNRKYGISGAQPVEYFAQALNQLWEESKPLQDIGEAKAGQTCDDETCSI